MQGGLMNTDQERNAHRRFVQALQHKSLTCAKPGCGRPMDITDLTPHLAPITMMAEVHLLHDQPTCPFDDTPITFTSMPKPRRKARYRLSCFYCGRHTEMNW